MLRPLRRNRKLGGMKQWVGLTGEASRVASLGGTAEGLSPHEHIRASCYSFLAGNRVCPNPWNRG